MTHTRQSRTALHVGFMVAAAAIGSSMVAWATTPKPLSDLERMPSEVRRAYLDKAETFIPVSYYCGDHVMSDALRRDIENSLRENHGVMQCGSHLHGELVPPNLHVMPKPDVSDNIADTPNTAPDAIGGPQNPDLNKTHTEKKTANTATPDTPPVTTLSLRPAPSVDMPALTKSDMTAPIMTAQKP